VPCAINVGGRIRPAVCSVGAGDCTLCAVCRGDHASCAEGSEGRVARAVRARGCVLCAEDVRGDALCAVLHAGVVEGVRYVLEVLEGCAVLLCMLEVVFCAERLWRPCRMC
jgi:hypothetical protein